MALWYASALPKMLNKEIDWDTDNIRATLHLATYTPNRDTQDYVDDLTNELATANGYTQGGVALASKTMVTTAANSWGTQRANSTPVEADWIVRPAAANGFLYRSTAAGTTGGSVPTFPTTVGATVVDGGVTWTCVGRAIVVLDCGLITWAQPFTALGARYCVISDRTPGTAATQPLIGLIDFGGDEDGLGGSYEVDSGSQGLLHAFII